MLGDVEFGDIACAVGHCPIYLGAARPQQFSGINGSVDWSRGTIIGDIALETVREI